MTTLIRCSLAFALSGVAALASDSPIVRVVGSADLQLAIVHEVKASAGRDALHAAFAASLGKAVGAVGGVPTTVQMKWVGADQAAFGLSTGRFHVVLAIGKTLPHALVLGDTVRLKATLGAGKDQQEAYLIFSGEDPGLDKLLTESYAAALSDPRFLDAFDGGIDAQPDPGKVQTLASNGR